MEINEGLTDPKISARLAELSGAALQGSPADFGKLITGSIEKFGTMIRAAHIKPEQ
jgi:hypothetical protein